MLQSTCLKYVWCWTDNNIIKIHPVINVLPTYLEVFTVSLELLNKFSVYFLTGPPKNK